jgi:hypothetical protein
LDRQHLITLDGERMLLIPLKGLRAVAGPAAGYGAMLGGVVGAVAGAVADGASSAPPTAPTDSPDQLLLLRQRIVENRLLAPRLFSNAALEGRCADWFFRSDGKRWHFVFDDIEQLKVAVPALSQFFAGAIEVKAVWNGRLHSFTRP